jgi:hypothetical protein
MNEDENKQIEANANFIAELAKLSVLAHVYQAQQEEINHLKAHLVILDSQLKIPDPQSPTPGFSAADPQKELVKS